LGGFWVKGKKLLPLKMGEVRFGSHGQKRRNLQNGQKYKKPLQNGRALRF
jgi:hypothetical protein